jgi:hypothetical protein
MAAVWSPTSFTLSASKNEDIKALWKKAVLFLGRKQLKYSSADHTMYEPWKI